jgi:hypothetical protein
MWTQVPISPLITMWDFLSVAASHEETGRLKLDSEAYLAFPAAQPHLLSSTRQLR